MEDANTRSASVDGIGPFRLVRNRMTYAHYPNKRDYQTKDEVDPVTENGLILFAGARSSNVLIPDWLEEQTMRKSIDSKTHQFKAVNL